MWTHCFVCNRAKESVDETGLLHAVMAVGRGWKSRSRNCEFADIAMFGQRKGVMTRV